MQLEYDTDDLLGNREIQPKSPGIAPRTLPGCLPSGFDCHAGDRYQRKGVNLVESALENGRIEQHLRLGNEKQEIPDNGIWDVGYGTDSLAFLPPSQRFVKGSYN